MYQYYQIIKRILEENTHMNLNPLQPYDNLETNDTELFETSFERSISTQQPYSWEKHHSNQTYLSDDK